MCGGYETLNLKAYDKRVRELEVERTFISPLVFAATVDMGPTAIYSSLLLSWCGMITADAYSGCDVGFVFHC